MVRGTTQFICDNCGKKFEGLDIELAATIFSTPLPCPYCGSRHTMPNSLLRYLQKGIYRRIWRGFETNSMQNKGDFLKERRE